MMNRTKRLSTAKVFAIILAAILCFASISIFTGCMTPDREVTTPLPSLTPPESVSKVHSVVITYNDTAVEGTLQTDISLGSLKVSATVNKDDGADGSLAFDSSDKTVATIDGEGNITLRSAGETVISATFGTEKSSFVLIVEGGTISKYTVTVVDGRADFTTAAAGDIVTITPVNPAHKDFSKWIYSGSETPITWISGNMFKMPEGNVTIRASFVDIMYTMRLVGGKVTSDGNPLVQEGELIGYYGGTESLQTAILEYKYAYGTKLAFSAIKPTDGGSEMMFVGWDENTANNRNAELEEKVSDYSMSDETVTYYANYSKIVTNDIFKDANINQPAWNATRIDGAASGADPDFEGLSGYTFEINGQAKAEGGYNEYIKNVVGLDTLNHRTQAVRAIFKNRGSKDVTVELYGRQVGNIATTGWVTVPAGATVTKTFLALPGFKISPNAPSWGFSVRKDVVGGGTDKIPFDIVAGSADAFPDGDIYSGVEDGTKIAFIKPYSSSGAVAWNRPSKWTSTGVGGGMNGQMPAINKDFGMSSFAAYEKDNSKQYVLEMPLQPDEIWFDDDDNVTVYIRMINTAYVDHSYSCRFFLSSDDMPVRVDEDDAARAPIFDENGDFIMKNYDEDNAAIAWKDVTVSKFGQVELIALRLHKDDLIKSGNNYVLNLGIIKFGYDTPDGSKPDSTDQSYAENFSIIPTYNNGIGFDGVVYGIDGKAVA